MDEKIRDARMLQQYETMVRIAEALRQLSELVYENNLEKMVPRPLREHRALRNLASAMEGAAERTAGRSRPGTPRWEAVSRKREVAGRIKENLDAMFRELGREDQEERFRLL